MPGFGFGYRFSRRQNFEADRTPSGGNVLYGPNYKLKGPTKFLVSVWNQSPTGYCYETNNLTENLYAKWKARGVNTLKHQHPDFAIGGQGDAVLAACQANDLMLLSSPRWNPDWGDRPTALDYRSLAMTDPYWRTNWIAYAFLDEPDLYAFSQAQHVTFFNGNALGGVRKPGVVNFTWRISSPQTPEGTESTNWRSFFQEPLVNEITHDTYSWHLEGSDANDGAGERTAGGYHLTPWNGYGPYENSLDPSLEAVARATVGRRFTASRVGLNVHISRAGPVTRGRSEDGGVTILPPHGFNTPPGIRGTIVLPTPLDYAPGDKAVGHYVATGRVDFISPTFLRGGRHAPARYLRDDVWSGIVHGSSHVLIFPQAPSGGSMVVTGYVDAATHQLVVTIPNTRTAGASPNIGGAMAVTRVDNGATVGWIRRDNPQISGTPYAEGTYALDNAKVATVTTGSAGSPVQFRLWSAEGFSGDGTDAPNAAELTTATANIARMQAHPTGGNLLMDTAQGGRRSFTALRCPEIDGNPRLYKQDMTLAPMVAGYTGGGTPITDDSGGNPQWLFRWPIGFEGFHVLGDDGALYIYVKSLSNGDRPTWFPGFAALGLPARVFGPFELVGFRRVGSGSAVEMTSTSGVLKAGVDDGAATWFWIETASISQNEGNSGTTAYAFTIRRGGDTSGTNTVTATVSGTGPNPANAADFQGGSFPTQVLSFAAGETSKVFTANVNGDTSAEVDETFLVTLSSPSGGAQIVGSNKGTLTNTIVNDDAPVASAFVWLGASLTGAPALSGSPSSAVHLNVTETSNVTRAGITMRSRSGGATAYDNGLFANVPAFLTDNAFNGALFVLPAGNWEFGFIAASASWGGGISGTVRIVDDPSGAANVRQSAALSGSGALLMDSDGTNFTGGTAIADAVNNLTYLPVTVTDIGGGNGLVQIHGTSGAVQLAAVSLRQV